MMVTRTSHYHQWYTELRADYGLRVYTYKQPEIYSRVQWNPDIGIAGAFTGPFTLPSNWEPI